MNMYYIIAEATAQVAKQGPNYKTILIASIVIALIVGLIRILCLKGQLTSVHKSESAADYTRDNSFKLETKRDLFLYSKTEKKEKPQSEANK
ncbi:hypothetical protein SAMN02910339_01485 [Lachnospiraceae bacterium YSD2013]|jgi:hypothetical protein|nr:hypothetical protein SAMN02910339_01485 [Lachnospiraceae bacterium YSD2013]